MTASGFLHINIRCTDLERTRNFYQQLLGLIVGDRPPFESTGYWVSLGGEPLIHLVQRGASESTHAGSGHIDHIAFQGMDVEATRSVLRDAGLPFRETVVPRDGTVQILVRDPDGIQVELTFDRA